jgi:hypothetical protein
MLPRRLLITFATFWATASWKRGICGASSAAALLRRPYGTRSDEAWRKALLVCGIASSLLYALMIRGIRYERYGSQGETRHASSMSVPECRQRRGALPAGEWIMGRRLLTCTVAVFLTETPAVR